MVRIDTDTNEAWAESTDDLQALQREATKHGTVTPFRTVHLAGIENTEYLCQLLRASSWMMESVEAEWESSGTASQDGILYSRDLKTLLFCPSLRTEDIVIPEGTVEISKMAMQGLDIERIVLPSTLVKMSASSAFYGRGAFSRSIFGEVVFAEGTRAVQNFAFYGAKIKKLTLPQSLHSIRDSAFRECGLKSVKLPGSLRYIEKSAFEGCQIKEISIPASVERIGTCALGPGLENIRIGSPEQLNCILNGVVNLPEDFDARQYRRPITVELNGTKFALPSHMVNGSGLKTLRESWKDGRFDAKAAGHLYRFAKGPAWFKQDVALAQLKCTPKDTEVRDYVGRFSRQILERSIKAHDKESTLALINSGLATQAALENALHMTDDETEKAYILNALSQKKKRNSMPKL